MKINAYFIAVVFGILLSACSSKKSANNFDRLLKKGNFALIEQQIDSLKKCKNTQWSNFELDSIKQLIRGIRRDFSLSEVEMKKQLQKIFPKANDPKIIQWEKSKKLEMRYIDGEKRYFANAVPNLQRLLTFDANKKKHPGFHVDPNPRTASRLKHISEVIAQSTEHRNAVLPQNMLIAYTLTVKPNVVPAGKIIRCWLPSPREGNLRQTGFHLLKSEPLHYTLAPNDYQQRTFYMEKIAIKNKPTIFSVQFSIQTKAQYFNLKPGDIHPYDTTSSVYIKNTCERPPHIVFSPKIIALGKQIVGQETNPLKKAEAIYRWINDSIPWASALEYGTIPNIPEYVLTNRHGDCGMHTLLFITLARSQGIPAKWQSGFVIEPGHAGLHDWGEIYYEGIGWVPVDQSYKLQPTDNVKIRNFYMHGIDAFRLIINDDYAQTLYPPKTHPRSEPYDFQRGEVEWEGRNLYFDQWKWKIEAVHHRKKPLRK